MPRFGQHEQPICWAVAASNSLWWFAQNGYPALVDQPDPVGFLPQPNTRYQDVAGRMDIGTLAKASQVGNPVEIVNSSFLHRPPPDGSWFDDAAGMRRLIRRVIQSTWFDWSG